MMSSETIPPNITGTDLIHGFVLLGYDVVNQGYHDLICSKLTPDAKYL